MGHHDPLAPFGDVLKHLGTCPFDALTTQESSHLRSILRITHATDVITPLLQVGKTKRALNAAHTNAATKCRKISTVIKALGVLANKSLPATAQPAAFGTALLTARAQWRMLCNRYGAVERERRENNVITPEELQRMLPLSDLAAAAKRATHATRTESQHKILLTIAAHVWPKRADWAVRIASPKYVPAVGENVLFLSETIAKLHLASYKTSRAYGVYEEELPRVVAEVIRDSVRRYPRRYLLQQEKAEAPWTHQAISEQMPDIFEKHTGKRIGVNTLRHMWISQRVDYNKMTISETNAIAAKMLHSPAEQRKYFRVGGKFDT